MTLPRASFLLTIVFLAGASAERAAAQQIRTIYSPSELREDPGAMLTRHLKTLSDSPRNLNALVGAGQASFALGDPQSALTFFGRAEEVSPRDLRVKAGMGACFALLEQPALALRYFSEAGTLTGESRDYVAHRGLAHDLVGNSRQAQADYRVALRDGEKWVVRERLALSLAIAGDQPGALQTIEPQLRRSDRAAWRVRAFILALGGDATGATEAARAVVPQSAAQLQPFFARLPTLTASEKAMAVHFGHMPAAGGQYAQRSYPQQSYPLQPSRQTSDRQPVAQTTPAPRPDPLPSAAAPTAQQVLPRPAASWPAAATLAQRQTAPPIAAAALPPSTITPQAETPVARPSPAPVRIAANDTPPAASPPAAVSKPEPASAPRLAAATSPAPAAAKPAERVPFGRPSGPIDEAPSRFADIAELLKVLPDPEPAPAAKAPAKKTEVAAKKPAPKAAAKPKAPARIWVQVAGGADKNALPREFTRLKSKAPKLFEDRSPWTTPLNATNRLLVGPFKTEKDAQSFVNDLSEAGLSGFSWTSPEGQEIAKLAAG